MAAAQQNRRKIPDGSRHAAGAGRQQTRVRSNGGTGRKKTEKSSQKPQKQKKQKKQYIRQKKQVICGIIAVLVLAAGLLVYGMYHLKQRDAQYAAQEKTLQDQIDAEKDYAKQLEEEEIYVNTKKYIEDTARSKWGLVYPDEKVVRPEKEE